MTASLVLGVRSFHDILLTFFSWLAFLGAGALLLPGVRARLGAWLEAVDAADRARVLRGVLTLGALGAAWAALLKACQLVGWQLTTDSAIMPNTAAGFWAGRGFESVLDGTPSALSVHFAFFVPLFLGPILFLWQSALPFALVQGAAVGSVGLAAFLLTERRTGSRFWGFVAMALICSHASFHAILTADIENSVFVVPLLLWGLVSWDSGRRWAAAALWTAALTTREQFPFSLAGLGVYHALASARPARRRWLEGAGIVAGAALIWAAEMRFVGSYPNSINTSSYWTLYSRFGASRAEIIQTILTRPDKVLAAVFWPPGHLLPLVRVLAGAAFIPLADIPAMAFLLISIVHNLLQDKMYLHLQNESYAFGPLVFATACGLRKLLSLRRFSAEGRLWVLGAALVAAGVGLRRSSRVIHPAFNIAAAREAPGLAAMIPPGASLWTDDWLAAPLSARPQVKTFTTGYMRPRFDVLLFRPEYVLVDKVTLISLLPADLRQRVFGFLAREGYRKLAATRTFVLLADPRAPHRGRSPALDLASLPADPAGARRLAAYALDSEQARAELAALPPDLRYAPVNADQHAMFAQALAARGLIPAAIAHGRMALTLRPDFGGAHVNLGNALAAAGDLPAAEHHLREGRRLLPEEGLAAYNLGNVLLRAGKPAEAVAVLEDAARLMDRDARAFNSLGAAHLLVGQRDLARAAFERALALDPALDEARENLKGLH